jgi:hypothetical protein
MRQQLQLVPKYKHNLHGVRWKCNSEWRQLWLSTWNNCFWLKLHLRPRNNH